MPMVGIGVVLAGYSILYYGLSQLKGGNWSLLDLTVPSRWTIEKAALPRDGK